MGNTINLLINGCITHNEIQSESFTSQLNKIRTIPEKKHSKIKRIKTPNTSPTKRFQEHKNQSDIFQKSQSPSKSPKKIKILLSLNSFLRKKNLGCEKKQNVVIVRRKEMQKLYVMKIFKKTQQTKQILFEKSKLAGRQAKNKFLLKIKCIFESNLRIHVISGYMQGGSLYNLIKDKKFLSESMVVYYSAEIILALQYIHNNLNIAYENLSLKHILLDLNAHIRLINFPFYGLIEKNINDIIDYEILEENLLIEKKKYDFYSLGIVLFQMITGEIDFKINKEKQIEFPIFFSENTIDIIKKLTLNEFNDINEIKSHEFFKKINWKLLEKNKLKPPIKIDFESKIEIGNIQLIDNSKIEKKLNFLCDENMEFDRNS